MSKGLFTPCSRLSTQNAQDLGQAPAMWIWRAKSNNLIPSQRMGLESMPPQRRQTALCQRRDLVSPSQNGTSDVQDTVPPQAKSDIVHVDKLMPYYPDFGEELHIWIESDHPTQYRDQEAQTSRPVLQSQPEAVVETSHHRYRIQLPIQNPQSNLQMHQAQCRSQLKQMEPTPPN